MSIDYGTEALKAKMAARAKSLELLYDYTKFHIGVYLTLTSAYVAVASIKVKDGGTGNPIEYLETNSWLVVIAVCFFVIAGLAGGIIVSSITQFTGGGSNEFLATPLGPWGAKIHLMGRTWTYIEHTSFWLGLFAAIGSIALPQIARAYKSDVGNLLCKATGLS